MREFPHHYTAFAAGGPDGDITLTSDRLPELRSAAPAEFDGPGDRWSPETLLTAAVADCFMLTFRALARYSRLPWQSLTCRASGTLERAGRATRFTGFTVKATLRIADEAHADQARRILARAEEACLISNSLKGPVRIEMEVQIGREARAGAAVGMPA
jgi:peroxiredoxin-like protein